MTSTRLGAETPSPADARSTPRRRIAPIDSVDDYILRAGLFATADPAAACVRRVRLHRPCRHPARPNVSGLSNAESHPIDSGRFALADELRAMPPRICALHRRQIAGF